MYEGTEEFFFLFRFSSELRFEKTATYRRKSDPDNSLCGAACTERDSVGVNGPAFSMPTPVHAVTLIKSTKVKDRDISAAIHPYFNSGGNKQPEQWREPSKLDQMFLVDLLSLEFTIL